MNIIVHNKAAEQLLAHARDQIPFAAMIAINRTGEDANQAIRAHMRQAFTIRDKRVPEYVAPVRLPRINQATKRRLFAILATEGKGKILAPFEYGTTKKQTDPLQPIAVPTQHIRFSEGTVIPRKWYPANLGLVPKRGPNETYFALGRGAIKKKLSPYKTTARGVVQIKGKHRTFVLDPKHHRGIKPSQHGVYVRIGSQPEDIRMIWQYRREVKRPKILDFVSTTRRTVASRYPINFKGAMTHAMATRIVKASR